jgi:hypothetical protein
MRTHFTTYSIVIFGNWVDSLIKDSKRVNYKHALVKSVVFLNAFDLNILYYDPIMNLKNNTNIHLSVLLSTVLSTMHNKVYNSFFVLV